MSDSALDTWLERTIAKRVVAPGAAITAIRRAPLPHIGSYDCERVSIELEDGAKLGLFLKDYARSRQSKNEPGRRRTRELRVYSELLDGAGLGAPAYYGSAADTDHDRFWLLLELVEGDVVEQVDSRTGTPAVEWLARMQAHYLAKAAKLEQCDFLIEHNEAYFLTKASDARRDVAKLAPECSTQFTAVLERYEQSIATMMSRQPTLVHGGYIPWHIFVDWRRDPPRIAVVDWELAARGSPLYDLAIFIDDAAPPLRDELTRTYLDAASRHGVPLPDNQGTLEAIECFRLHRIIDWLSRSVEREFSQKKVARLVERAASHCEKTATNS